MLGFQGTGAHPAQSSFSSMYTPYAPTMTNPLNIENVRLPETQTHASAETWPARSLKPPRHTKGQRFLRGPIPWTWIAAAGATPGRGLHVGVALWLESGMGHSATVVLSYVRLAEMGVNRYAARRGLRALEKTGLVSVERRRGRSPRVTINPAPVDRTPVGAHP